MSVDRSSELTRKVIDILRAVAQRTESDMRVVDIARRTGIPRPTVYRVVGELIDAGLMERADSGSYSLGHGMFELALGAPSPIMDMSLLRERAQSLADRCGDTVYVAVRQFGGVNYIVRAEGGYPLQTHVPVGTSRTLVQSFTGIALLPFVDDDQREHAILRRLSGLPDAEARSLHLTIEDLIRQVTQRGYCAVPEIVLAGVSGVATPIRVAGGRPYAAVSISAASARMAPERVAVLGRMLLATEKEMRAAFASPAGRQ